MKNHLPGILLLYVLFFIFHQTTVANELYPVPLTQRVQHSTLIAEGKVIAQNSFKDPVTRKIYTASQVMVYRTFKGILEGEEIEIITYGGAVGQEVEVYSSFLTLGVGQSGIFFCIPSPVSNKGLRRAKPIRAYMVYSSMQGFIQYHTDQQTAADPFTKYPLLTDAGRTIRQLTNTERMIRDNSELTTARISTHLKELALPTISNFAPATIPAGTDAVLTITGTGFGATQGTGFVEFKNANNGGAGTVRPLASDYISWTDTEIRVMVPSASTSNQPAGSGTFTVTNSDPATATSGTALNIPYAFINYNNAGTSLIPDHVSDNGAGGYTFQMEANFFANTAANAAFRRALQTWTCNTGMNWQVSASTTAVDSSASDGINVVTFDTLPAGVLGVCITYFSGCGAPLKLYVPEMDVVFNKFPPAGYAWEFGPAAPSGSEYDFESVALHEMGHGQLLTHVIKPGAVMHYALFNGQNSRTLGADDITGGQAMTTLGFAANSCGSPPMTPGQVYTLAATSGSGQVCATNTVAVSGTEYTDPSCNDIARIVPSGASPVSGSITVCAKYESGVPSINSQPYCERHYDIEPAASASTATGTITLYYTQAEFNAFNSANGALPDLPNGPSDAAGIANLRITQYHGTSTTGVPGSYTGSKELIDPADANIVWNTTGFRWEITFPVIGFSGFFVHTGTFALPLHLLQFSGSGSGHHNVLQWTTVAEQQAAYFDVQRSADGVSFTTVGQVDAAGNTTGQTNYRYTDKVSDHPQPIYYYRLKMVDNNAQFTYSRIVSLKRNNDQFLVKVLQNPFRQQLQVDITSPQSQTCVLTLTDMNGRKIAQRTMRLPDGNSIVDVPGAQQAGSGTYLLLLETPSEKRTIKVVKQP